MSGVGKNATTSSSPFQGHPGALHLKSPSPTSWAIANAVTATKLSAGVAPSATKTSVHTIPTQKWRRSPTGESHTGVANLIRPNGGGTGPRRAIKVIGDLCEGSTSPEGGTARR